MQYKTRGTCSQLINLELDGDVIKSVEFIGGCDGNLQGISKLVTGMKAEDAIKRLEGIQCGFKPTSCPDQLAKALRQALAPLPKATAALFHIQFSLIQEQMTLPGSPAVPSTYDSGRPHISLRPDMLCVTQRICLLFVLYYPHRLPLQLSCQNLCINIRNLRFLWGM